MSRIPDLFDDLDPAGEGAAGAGGAGLAAAGAPKGLRCPACGASETNVKDSRPADGGDAIRRRRQCSECGHRFSTLERVQGRDLAVRKNDGTTQPFSRDKLARSLTLALRKRPVEQAAIDDAIRGILRRLEQRSEPEVTAREIGGMVLRALARLDQVALVRYASVYFDFNDVSEFSDIVADIQTAEARRARLAPAATNPTGEDSATPH